MNKKTLEEIEAALAGATPGEWSASVEETSPFVAREPMFVGVVSHKGSRQVARTPAHPTRGPAKANVELIALLRNNAESLIAAAKKLVEVEAQNEQLRDALAEIGSMLPEQFTASWAGQRAREALSTGKAGDRECITCAGTGRVPSRRYFCSKCNGTGNELTAEAQRWTEQPHKLSCEIHNGRACNCRTRLDGKEPSKSRGFAKPRPAGSGTSGQEDD